MLIVDPTLIGGHKSEINNKITLHAYYLDQT